MFDPEKFKGGSALVIGAGRSGAACAGLLASKGFKVLLTEGRKADAVKENLKGLSRSIKVETGGHGKGVFKCSFAVKSPGMSPSNPLIAALKARKIPVFSEIETALAFSGAGKLLAVTGTNGKTTTTLLLGEIMKAALAPAGGRALVCGNVGIPAAAAAPKAGPRDAVVMEVSSYQLEDSLHISPDAAGVLNITPDHLDHHGSMAAYIRAKRKIFRFQDSTGSCVFNYEDVRCRRLAEACPSPLFFSSKRRGGKLSAWAWGGRVFFKHGGRAFSVKPPALPGAHNLENAMCAGLMALHCGAKPGQIQKVFKGFTGVEHRIERAGKVRGVSFINDSKATNVESTLVALKALGSKKNIWLILGGQGKGNPYTPLKPLIGRSVKAVLTIGADAARIEKELAGACPLISCGTVARACRAIMRAAVAGDIALFSPACASFDQFRDFEDRGRKFKAIVKRLG